MKPYDADRSRTHNRRIATWLVGLVVAGAICAGLLYAWNPETDRVVAPATAARPGPAERTAALAPLNLPADDAPHGARMEWWYYSGILDAAGGQRYGFHTAVFVANGLVKHTVMHVALTDLQTGKRYASQKRTGGVAAQASTAGFDFRQEGWRVSGAGPTHLLRAAFDGVSVALDLTDARPPVAHRAAGSETPGLLDFGPGGISYYYSRPRIAARGEISVGGKAVPVKGQVWFDHQWGDFDAVTLGWNWFALHLTDGSDVMLYALFDAQGRPILTAGTVSTASGSVALKPGEIELTPLDRWTSPHTRVDYPVGWRIRLPSGELTVKPIVADSEFDARETTANIYWEGPVRATGTAGGGGEGFMELSGYERLNAARAPGK